MAVHEWIFQNLTCKSPMIPIQSLDHGIELFMEATGENEFAVVLEFSRLPKGAIESIAGPEFGTLAFDPDYDPKSHTLSGFRSAVPRQTLVEGSFYFDDGSCASSVPSEQLLAILDIIQGLRYIWEHHDFPPFLKWRSGC